jgi:hypothetical protein
VATITVDVGATCPGGNHFEIIVYRNGVEVYRSWESSGTILPGGIPFNSVKEAADYIIKDTSAPNMTAWKNKIKNKSVVVADDVPAPAAKAEK